MPNPSPNIIPYLSSLPKQELIKLFLRALNLMDPSQQDQLLGDWQFEQRLKGKTQKEVIVLLQDFVHRSKAGEFYKPFFMNSKNYTHVPPETEIWYAEMSRWLDYACQQANDGNNAHALEVLTPCLDLLDESEGDENIVFAHEYGDWMLAVNYDYRTIYHQISGG
jgi:hypothetical protein